MKYTKGTIGRVFVVKFDNGDIFMDELRKLAVKEKIKSGVMVFLGALKEGVLVTGPKKAVVPPVPNRVSFHDGWEVMGVGSIFSNPSGPQLHVHSSMGKRRKVFTGCLRERSRVFLVVEAVVFELRGVAAGKDIDPATGLNLLKIMSK